MRGWIGLGLLGYGFLVLIGLTAHESPWAGAASLTLGALLCWSAARQHARAHPHRRADATHAGQADGGIEAASGDPGTAEAHPLGGAPTADPGDIQHPHHARTAHAAAVAAIGAVCLGGVLAYNAWRGSDLGAPEWAILVYGVLLLLASTRLTQSVGRTDVGSLVAWSFPLVLAPLAMFATNAAFTDESTALAASPWVHALVVEPTAVGLRWLGTPVALDGNNMVLATPRGGLVLGVGLVCAGLYPMVLFASLLGLHAWQNGLPRTTVAKHLGLGLGGLWLLNILRLLILTQVGIRWGGSTLQTVHAHIGWILFAAFMIAYWALVRPAPRETKDRGTAVPAGEDR